MQSNGSECEEQNGAEDPTLTQHTSWEFYFGAALIWFHELNAAAGLTSYALRAYLPVYFRSKIIQSECFEMNLQCEPKYSKWWQLEVLLPKHTPNLNQKATADTPNAYCVITLKVVRGHEEGSSR